MNTPPLRFDIPGYNQAMVELMEQVVEGFAAQDGLLAQLPVRRTLHSGPSRAVREPQPLDQPLGALEYVLTIPFEVIRTTDIDAFTQILYQFAQSYKGQMGASLFQTLDAVTEAVGNKIDAQGQPLSFDLINDMLEKIQLGADGDGRVHPPTIYAHPDMAQKLAALQPTDAQRQRYASIMQRKQAEHHAQKRTRRLSR